MFLSSLKAERRQIYMYNNVIQFYVSFIVSYDLQWDGKSSVFLNSFVNFMRNQNEEETSLNSELFPSNYSESKEFPETSFSFLFCAQRSFCQRIHVIEPSDIVSDRRNNLIYRLLSCLSQLGFPLGGHPRDESSGGRCWVTEMPLWVEQLSSNIWADGRDSFKSTALNPSECKQAIYNV